MKTRYLSIFVAALLGAPRKHPTIARYAAMLLTPSDVADAACYSARCAPLARAVDDARDTQSLRCCHTEMRAANAQRAVEPRLSRTHMRYIRYGGAAMPSAKTFLNSDIAARGDARCVILILPRAAADMSPPCR
jgi:hypothetical protein